MRIARLQRRNKKLKAIVDVAKALSAERNLDNLLNMILAASVRTVDAERGSLFLMNRDGTELWSKIAHGLGREVIRLRVGTGLAGHVAQTGQILNIPDAYGDERFNRELDTATGFRTVNVLCIPMLGQNGNVVGVVQALNHEHGPFTEDDEDLLLALGANAAVAIENANLYKDIERLFEGFVTASVTAIEARDPTTSGHSTRVAGLSVELMKAIPRSDGKYGNLRFGEVELREMRYASLLHDFGKVGVRENVLLKAAKLYPHESEMLEARFEHARRSHQVLLLQKQLEAMESGATAAQIAQLKGDFDREWQRIDGEFEAMLTFIRKCNQPTILAGGGFERLTEVADRTYRDLEGVERQLLKAGEALNLAIPQGSLNAEERREIESHVVHTHKFLEQIPWTNDLRRIPEYAHGHHEKLDGSGYPLGISGDRIPVQTRIMTIADIYDALTATDRPYKSAMTHERALAIIENECKLGKLDHDLFLVFVEGRVAQRALGR